MEPNVDDDIRDRVIAAEGMTVTWNRERVWNRIERKPSAPRATWLMYAAASIALTVLVVYYIPTRTTSPELSVSPPGPSVPEKHDLARVIPSSPSEARIVDQGANPKNQPESALKIAALIQPEVIPTDTMSQTTIEGSSAPAVTVSSDSVVERYVPAIIGLIPKEKSTVVKFKRRKIRLFPIDPLMPASGPPVTEEVLTTSIH
jgi:hypothetical protein